MRKLLLVVCIGFSCITQAQSDPVFSQYLYNHLVINPAYAGTRNGVSAVMGYRSRWTGITGTPTSQSLAVHSLIGQSNIALGVNMGRDQLGPVTNGTFLLSGAYHLKFRTGKLSIGLRGGIYNSSLNAAKLDFKDPADQFNTGNNFAASVATVDAGIYYYTQKLFVGVSLNHLTEGRLSSADIADADFFLRRFNTFSAAYAFELSDRLTLKPSFLLKSNASFDPNFDVGLSALMYKKIWFGVTFRNMNSVNFLLDLNITDFLRIGYSYDTFLNALGVGSNGVHELFLGFDFATKKKNEVSPRYF